MIDTLHYGIGFLVYVALLMVTITIYNKRKEKDFSVFPIYFIYIYYTLLASYVINFVDSSETFFVRFVQMVIYAAFAGIFLYLHYKDILERKIGMQKNKAGF